MKDNNNGICSVQLAVLHTFLVIKLKLFSYLVMRF